MGYGKTYKTKWLEDLSGNQGTANQVLISTSAGIAWATASTVIGGPYLPLSGGTMTGNTTHGDNVRSLYGASSDMQIYHDGSNSYVRDVGTGRLWIDSNGEGVSIISDGSGSTPMAHFYKDGAVELYHNNVRRFRTNDLGGVSIDHTSGSLGNSFFGGVSGASNGFQIANSSSNEITYTFQNGSNSQVLKILNNGNVGIGTTSPDEKLRVDGNIKSAGDFIGAALKLGFAGSANITTNDTNEDLLINPNGSGDILMHTTSTGNVGIGTSSPIAKLEVDGDIHPASNVSYSLGSSAKSFLFTNTYAVSSAGNLQLLAGGSEAMRIISSGNVGIGTTSPLAKTHISASGNLAIPGLDATLGTATSLAIGNNGGTVVLAAGVSNTNVSWLQGRQGTGTGNAFNISLNPLGGNVGIGTASPSANLDIEDSSGVTVDINSTSGDGLFRFQSAGTTKWSMGRDNTQQNFVIANSSGLGVSNVLTLAHSTGNVGIGTTSPEVKLAIKGDALTTSQPARITNSVTDTHTGLFLNNTGGTVGEKYGMQFGGYNQYSIGGIFGVLDSISGSTSGDITFDMCNGTASGALIERMRITHEGNIGIGTASPSFKLDARGSVRIISADENTLYLDTESTGQQVGIFYRENGASRWEQRVGSNFELYNYARASWDFHIQGSTGNVGIGTTSPDYQLEVERTSAQATIGITGGNTDARLHLKNNEGNWMIQNDYSNSGALSFYNNAHRVVIAEGGNVGIGTTSPSTKLHLADSSDVYLTLESTSSDTTEEVAVKYSNSATGSNYWWDGLNQSANWSLGYGTSFSGSNTRLLVDTSGNVGIGTTSPSEKLHIFGTTAAVKIEGDGVTSANLKFKTNETDRWNVNVPSGSTDLRFTTGSSDTLTLKSNGNVGIGTTSPQGTLSVKPSQFRELDFIESNSQMTMRSTAPDTSYNLRALGIESSDIVFRTGSTSGTTSTQRMVINSSGNVGIGTTSPSAKLQVDGDVRISGDKYYQMGGSNFKIGADGGGSAMHFYSGGNENMTLNSSGNVGIGTTAPNASALLDVSSTTKGVLLPRMSTTQINAISSPAEGLTVYNTVLSTLCFFNGVSWQKVTSANM